MIDATAGTIASRVDPGFMLVLQNCESDPDDFFAGLKDAEELGVIRQLPLGQIHSLEHLRLRRDRQRAATRKRRAPARYC